MTDLINGKVLIIENRRSENLQALCDSLISEHIEVVLDKDLGSAIHRAQTERFDIIVLDANSKGMPIERTIQILKSIQPSIKIIVKTDLNSKELEAKIRKETIYYYHLDSFGLDDLRLAIESAIRQTSGKIFTEQQSSYLSESTKLIFLVNEDDNFVEIHKTNLERHHFEVEISYDADQAIQKIKTKKPHLVMVDLNVPVGSAGLHFLEMMIDDEMMRAIPVLIFVMKEKLKKHEHILEKVKTTLPTWGYLEKPIKIEDIFTKVKTLL